jgi:hypothetical protein
MATRTRTTAKPATVTNGVLAIATLALSRETKGTYVYDEVDTNGNWIEERSDMSIGRVYIRKAKVNGTVPNKLGVEIRVVD